MFPQLVGCHNEFDPRARSYRRSGGWPLAPLRELCRAYALLLIERIGLIRSDEVRRCLGSFLSNLPSKLLEALREVLAVEMLRHQIGWMLLPQDLFDAHTLAASCVLDPESLRVKVPEFPQALSLSDPNRY